LWARSIVERTIAASSGSALMPITNVRSIFSVLTGSFFM